MKILLTISIILFSIAAQSQSAGQLLEKAHKNNSSELLNQFFQNWSQEIQPVTGSDLLKLNDTLKQAYSAFTAFYKPQGIDSLGGSEWGNDIYKNVSFLIVQNFIEIYFTDKIYYTEQEIYDYVNDYITTHLKTDPAKLKDKDGKYPKRVIENFGPDGYGSTDVKKILTDSIVNFRPQINCGGKTPLYLTSKYDSILNAFLGNKHIPLGTGGIMNPARSAGESEKRKTFLEKYIKIWYGHWGGYWQLNSYPVAYSITFDKDMNYAKINFRLVYEGGEAILRKDNGKWILISSKRTWIE